MKRLLIVLAVLTAVSINLADEPDRNDEHENDRETDKKELEKPERPPADLKPETPDTAAEPAAVEKTAPGEAGDDRNWREGLVLYLPFDEDEGTLALDASPAGNNGVVHDASWTAEGKRGGGYSFARKGDWIEVTNSASLNLEDEVTLAAWVKVVPTSGRESAIISKKSSYTLYIHAGQPLSSMFTSEETVTVAHKKLPEDEWWHMASVYDGENLTLYLDGKPVKTTSATGELNQNQGVVQIGKRHYGKGDFSGMIDEVTVHDRALSASEIKELCDATGK